MGEGKKTLMKKIEMMHDEIDIKDVLEYQTIRLQVATLKEPKLLDFLDDILAKIVNKAINKN